MNKKQLEFKHCPKLGDPFNPMVASITKINALLLKFLEKSNAILSLHHWFKSYNNVKLGVGKEVYFCKGDYVLLLGYPA